MYLILVRHGQAVSETEDPLRPLSACGVEEIKKTALLLSLMGLSVSRILCSQKERARQTAGIIQELFCPDAELLVRPGLAPNDPVEGMIEDLFRQNQNICVVGHLPYLPCLVAGLMARQDRRSVLKFNTGTAVVLQRTEENVWSVDALLDPAESPDDAPL